MEVMKKILFLIIGILIGVFSTIIVDMMFNNNSNDDTKENNKGEENVVVPEEEVITYFDNKIVEYSYKAYDTCNSKDVMVKKGKLYANDKVIYTCKDSDCEIIDGEHFYYCNATDSLVAIYDGDKSLLLNYKSKEVIMDYDDISYIGNQDNVDCPHCYAYFSIRKGKKVGLADIYGNILVEPIYDKIGNWRNLYGPGYNIKNQLVTVTKDEKVGVINIETGNIIVPIEYEYIKILSNNYIVRKDGKETLLDLNGEIVLNGDFDHINEFYGVVFAEKNNSLHFYNLGGELLTKESVEVKETAKNNPSTGYGASRINNELFIKVYNGGLGEYLACYKLNIVDYFDHFAEIDCSSLENDYCIYY